MLWNLITYVWILTSPRASYSLLQFTYLLIYSKELLVLFSAFSKDRIIPTMKYQAIKETLKIASVSCGPTSALLTHVNSDSKGEALFKGRKIEFFPNLINIEKKKKKKDPTSPVNTKSKNHEKVYFGTASWKCSKSVIKRESYKQQEIKRDILCIEKQTNKNNSRFLVSYNARGKTMRQHPEKTENFFFPHAQGQLYQPGVSYSEKISSKDEGKIVIPFSDIQNLEEFCSSRPTLY